MNTRSKTENRTEFTYCDRIRIGKKSNNKCCHCGEVYLPEYGATIDHFVPLNQGGTNDDANLVMLCQKCNEEKTDKIYPISYLKYLKEEEKERTEKYFKDYTQSIEFFDRRNILACDKYDLILTRTDLIRKGAAPVQSIGSYNRVTSNDMGRVTEFFVKYLKKRDNLDGEDFARQNLEFWFRFGCLYYAERGGEIKVLAAITFTKALDEEIENVRYYMKIFLMPYYTTEITYNMAYYMVEDIPHKLLHEQGLDMMPVVVQTVDTDRFLPWMSYEADLDYFHLGDFLEIRYISTIVGQDDKKRVKAIIASNRMIKNLGINIEKMEEYLKEHPGVEWMKIFIDENAISVDDGGDKTESA